jgi:MFS family permease
MIASDPQAVDTLPSRTKTWKTGTLTYTAGGILALFLWLLIGDFSWSIKERSISPVLQLMLKVFGASDLVVGLFMGALPSAISILLLPIISSGSDRHRGPLGRRIPYLLALTPVAAAGVICLGFSPQIAGVLNGFLGPHSPGRNTLTILCFGIFWTVFEVGTIATNALFTALINDVVPHTLLGRFYGLFRALSLLVGIGFNWWIMGKAESNFLWIFLATGALYGVGFTGMCFRVKEGTYPPPEAANANSFLGTMRTYFSECFSKPYYLAVFFMMTTAISALSAASLFSVAFAKHLHVSMDAYGKCWGVTFFLSLLISYPMGALVDRMHPLRVTLATLGLYLLTAIWAGFCVRDGHTFSVAIVVTGVLAGCFWTSSASLGQRLFPRSRFAQYSSAAAILTSVASLILGPGLGEMLDLTGNDYRQTFTVSAILAALALVSGCYVYYWFLRFGGPLHYTAPE